MKVRCIIKRPDEEFGHVTNISVTLENLQKTVGGMIEVVPVAPGTVLICNEEGKIRGLEPNFMMGFGISADCVVGTVIVIGVGGKYDEEFVDLKLTFGQWKAILREWGN